MTSLAVGPETRSVHAIATRSTHSPPVTVSEAHPHCQLKRPRAARPENLCRPGGWLPERRGADEIAAMAREVRGVVGVEHLADQRQTAPLFKNELPAHPQIERLKIVAKPVTIRQRQSGDRR